MKLIPKYQKGTPKKGVLYQSYLSYIPLLTTTFVPNGIYSITGQPYEVWKRETDLEAARRAYDKNELIGPAQNIPEDLEKYYRRRGETLLWMDQRARNFESFGNLLNLTMPSTYVGQIIGRQLTGPEALAVDLGTAPVLNGIKTVGKKGVQTATKLAAKGAEAYRRRFVYPREGLPQWFYTQKPLIARALEVNSRNNGLNISLYSRKALAAGGPPDYMSIQHILKIAKLKYGKYLNEAELGEILDGIGLTEHNRILLANISEKDLDVRLNLYFKAEETEAALEAGLFPKGLTSNEPLIARGTNNSSKEIIVNPEDLILRKIFSIEKYGKQPIYTREQANQILRNRKLKYAKDELNPSLDDDITYIEENVGDGPMLNTMSIVRKRLKLWNESGHGRIMETTKDGDFSTKSWEDAFKFGLNRHRSGDGTLYQVTRPNMKENGLINLEGVLKPGYIMINREADKIGLYPSLELTNKWNLLIDEANKEGFSFPHAIFEPKTPIMIGDKIIGYSKKPRMFGPAFGIFRNKQGGKL